jgi:hypothetical protein
LAKRPLWVQDAPMDEGFPALFEQVLSRPAALGSWLPQARGVLEKLQHFREPGTVQREERWQWYALSRVNDVLIGALTPELPHRQAYLKQDVYRRDQLFGIDALVEGRLGPLAANEYRGFFGELGFSAIEGGPFSPFHHEIVEVIADGSNGITVDHVFWPGWMFGQMLFARAGVRVRSGVLNKNADRTPLYFSWWRPQRDTEDLSHGWGSSSQWRTDFRRDYQTPTQLRFNLDGKWPVADEVVQRPDGDLTVEERIELLTHRSFVRSEKRPWGRWPYQDTFDINL